MKLAARQFVQKKFFQLRTIFAESGVTKLRQPKTPQILQLNRLAYV